MSQGQQISRCYKNGSCLSEPRAFECALLRNLLWKAKRHTTVPDIQRVPMISNVALSSQMPVNKTKPNKKPLCFYLLLGREISQWAARGELKNVFSVHIAGITVATFVLWRILFRRLSAHSTKSQKTQCTRKVLWGEKPSK